jgi:hypothetical protein
MLNVAIGIIVMSVAVEALPINEIRQGRLYSVTEGGTCTRKVMVMNKVAVQQ